MGVPVVAKEVGWGISESTARRLAEVGVSAIDVAGSGGTSWSEVEYHRAPTDRLRRLARAFADWGIPTAETLLMARRGAPGLTVIASGGMRKGIEAAKALALGATAVGMASPFLKAAAARPTRLLRRSISLASNCAPPCFARARAVSKRCANRGGSSGDHAMLTSRSLSLARSRGKPHGLEPGVFDLPAADRGRDAEVLAIPPDAAAGHYQIMQYHMGWLDAELRPVAAPAGKRIRPLLCLLACAAAGGDPGAALPAAAGLELLHNFSLIHDDIEDDSPLRRHRPTTWTIFGLPITCNAGDAMFSLAHTAFYRMEALGVPPATVLAALRRFDEMCVALTEGQFLDMSFEGRLSVTPDDYFRMIAGKTGALLAVAPEIGALVAGAAPATVAAYRRYGAALGLAFQLQDDILGIWGDESATGKSAASDILSKKKSLPVLYALAHEAVGAELTALYAGADFTEPDVPAVLRSWIVPARAIRRSIGARATAEAHDALAALRPAVPERHRIWENCWTHWGGGALS